MPPQSRQANCLEWVNLDEGMIYILDNTTKNDEPLPLPISAQLRGLLKKLFRRNGPVLIRAISARLFRLPRVR